MSTSQNIAPVLIVGAGPAGLVLAISLAQNGIPVRILEKARTPHVGTRGMGLMPRSVELHHFIGTLSEISKRGWSPFPRICTYKSPDGVKPANIITKKPAEATDACPYMSPILIKQSIQVAILRERLEEYSCFVEFGTELRTLDTQASESYVEAHIVKTAQDGKELAEVARFAYVIGTDGGHSVVRRTTGFDFLGETRVDGNMVIGDFVGVEDVSREYIHLWGTPHTRMINLIPVGERDSRDFAFFMAGPELDYEYAASGREQVIKTFQEISGRHDIKFGDLIFLSKYRPNIRMVNEFSKGRVFLAGDAAHCHSPTGGQGLNSSIQDSFNLGWKLALVLKGLAPPTLLESYTAERLPVIAEVLQKSTALLNTAFKSDKPADFFKRGSELGQLGVNYRGSSIVVDERAPPEAAHSSYNVAEGGRVCAGDRAPDAPNLLSTGGKNSVTRLFDIFDTTCHTILVFTDNAAKAEPVLAGLKKYSMPCLTALTIFPQGSSETDDRQSVVEDSRGTAYAAYSVTAGDLLIVIVRPDGVIGAIVGGVDGVHDYFARIFL